MDTTGITVCRACWQFMAERLQHRWGIVDYLKCLSVNEWPKNINILSSKTFKFFFKLKKQSFSSQACKVINNLHLELEFSNTLRHQKSLQSAVCKHKPAEWVLLQKRLSRSGKIVSKSKSTNILTQVTFYLFNFMLCYFGRDTGLWRYISRMNECCERIMLPVWFEAFVVCTSVECYICYILSF